MSTTVSAETWKELERTLGIELATLRAVAAVESAGSGFSGTPPRPKILFEGHVFHRLTGGRFSQKAPNLSHPKWDKKKYSGSGAGEWKRLEAACGLDRSAALQSASWGMFQIMGFNYAHCGCSDVEAFVAQHHAGAAEQVACFSRFIARAPFLAALKAKDWAKFAAAYNGPEHAKNHYAAKMAAAYAQISDGAAASSAGSSKRGKRAASKSVLPPGRPAFAPVSATRRRAQQRRNVRPDAIDLRDWEYRPSIALAPPETLLPNDPRMVKVQGDTSACTGFALATVIEYLLERSSRPAERISGYMLYSMARRYDEWSEDDTEDTGSSLRGALKGWSRHGASAERMWKALPMPRASNTPGEDWWLDAVKRPMGAYYRIAPDNVRDIHVALDEVGAVYASALTHGGWDELFRKGHLPAPTTVEAIPVIPEARGLPDQGHAFAIVGYTRQGFIVQNSWGSDWGHGGFAVLAYSDWVRNAMDCWVVQLGVVTAEHELVAKSSSLRVEKSGRAVVSSNEVLASHEISPFVVNMGNEGFLSQRGRFRTNDDDLRALFEHHLPAARDLWKVAKNAPVDVAIYAHGGLTNEDQAAKTAHVWIPHLYSHQIFPIFLMWETGALDTLSNLFEDMVRGEVRHDPAGGRWRQIQERFTSWKDERLEGLARLPGGKLWGEMKQNAESLSGHPKAGVMKLFKLIQQGPAGAKPPNVRLHLIGHSAGAVVHSYLGARAIDRGLELASISLLVPAVRLDEFSERLGGAVTKHEIPVLIANLTDTAERNDETCRPYGHSLLYLVSRSFEGQDEEPLLGMEKHLAPALATEPWGEHVRQLPCPGGRWDEASAATRATSHGGVDDDEVVKAAVAAFIRKA